MQEKALRLRKNLLKPLLVFLDFPLSPKNGGRTRAKFVKIITQLYDSAEKERLDLLSGLCDRDDKNAPAMQEIIVQVKGEPVVQNHYKLSPENQRKFDEQNEINWKQEVAIEVNASNEAEVLFAKGLIINLDKEMKLTEEQAFADICEAFEKI